MKSKIINCSIWTSISSNITVENPDGTRVTFETPAKKDKTFDEYYTELRTLADAYIAAFDETHPEYAVTATATHDGTATIVEPVSPTPRILNGIKGETLIVCKTETERESVLSVLRESGLPQYAGKNNEGISDSDFSFAPDVYVRQTHFDTALRGFYDDFKKVAASDFIAANTLIPDTSNPVYGC